MPMFSRAPRRHRTAVVAVSVLAFVALAACAGPASEGGPGDSAASTVGSETPPPGTVESPSQSTASASPSTPPTTPAPPTQAGPALSVTIDGDDVGPNAAEIKLRRGEPLTITFDTDRGGQLHVHSKPEQYVDFGSGVSTKELVVTTPGTVEIEEHDTEAVVAVLEVR